MSLRTGWVFLMVLLAVWGCPRCVRGASIDDIVDLQYSSFFKRSPTGAEDMKHTSYLLYNGCSKSTVGNRVKLHTLSQEFILQIQKIAGTYNRRRERVRRLFKGALYRAPTSSEYSKWIGAMRNGTPFSKVVTSIVSSTAFARRTASKCAGFRRIGTTEKLSQIRRLSTRSCIQTTAQNYANLVACSTLSFPPLNQKFWLHRNGQLRATGNLCLRATASGSGSLVRFGGCSKRLSHIWRRTNRNELRVYGNKCLAATNSRLVIQHCRTGAGNHRWGFEAIDKSIHQEAAASQRLDHERRVAYNLDVVIRPYFNDNTFFNLQFFLEDTTTIGYMGIQQFSGSTDQIVLFSIFGSTECVGTDCRRWNEFEDSGWNVRIHYTFSRGSPITLRMWRLSRSPEGDWWGCWILEGGSERQVGSLRAPPGAGDVLYSLLFTEYIGPPKACTAVPYSRVDIERPVIRTDTGFLGPVKLTSSSFRHCSGGRVTKINGGSRLELGID